MLAGGMIFQIGVGLTQSCDGESLCGGQHVVGLHAEADRPVRPASANAEGPLTGRHGSFWPAEGSAIELEVKGATWHTFAGGAINALLAASLETQGGEWQAGNLAVSTTDRTAAAGAVHAIREIGELDLAEVAAAAARHMRRGNLTKFQPCLPGGASPGLRVFRGARTGRDSALAAYRADITDQRYLAWPRRCPP